LPELVVSMSVPTLVSEFASTIISDEGKTEGSLVEFGSESEFLITMSIGASGSKMALASDLELLAQFSFLEIRLILEFQLRVCKTTLVPLIAVTLEKKGTYFCLLEDSQLKSIFHFQ
jgi:hypothetical protein